VSKALYFFNTALRILNDIRTDLRTTGLNISSLTTSTGIYFNPASDEVLDLIVNGVLEIVENYNVDGSSMTVFYKDGEVGCCSRNLELKDDGTSTFWETAKNEQLVEKLISLGKNIALQGELLGGQIQGNSYKITGFKFFLYDIYDIDKQEYLRPEVVEQFAAAHGISHVPIIGYVTLPKEDTIQALLLDADGKSAVGCNPKREGFVYKSTKDTSISVKCISNNWLLSNDD
jgi:ATP-dependent RNA circularization protein (DNA/RNA ligase family)